MPRPAESIAQIPTKMVNGMAKNTEIEQNGHSQSETHSRPPVIEEDLWEMERRKRVREVLGADDFRSELEQIVHPDFAKSFPEDLNFAVPPIGSLPRSATFGIQQQLPTLPALNVNQVLNTPPIPIADLPRNCPYSAEERRCRNKLATFYRLVDLFQWSQGIYNHITLRLPGTGSAQILINPFGLLYHEVTAGSLIKLNLAGDVLDQGSTNLGVNQAAYVLHSAIHEARPDVHCVLHLHTAVVSAVGCMKCGLLPICQEAMIIGPVGYHDYQGILTDEEEKKSIVRDLGDKNVLMLRNHGFVACGQSVEDAMHLAFHMVVACETQILILLDTASFICCGGSAEEVAWTVHNLVVACQNQIRAARAGIENLIVPSTEAVQKAYTIARRGGGGVNRIQQESGSNGSGTIPWGIGELEWEAWCRALDTAGFCTGHLYRNAQLRHRLAHSHHSMHNLASTSSSVATPSNGPASMGLAGESEAAAAWRLSMLRKERERTRWLNSPCQYEKVQLLETGTAHPRLITKWVEQGSASATRSSSGTPVKIDSPHQFSPCNGADSREFRERQRRLKEVRMSGTCSPGPKSQVLEGTTLEHGERPFNGETKSHQAAVYIGTASKGIIQREHQINAQVYRQLYAPNPFIGHSEQDLKQYLKEVGGKCKGKCAEDNNTITGVSSLPSSPSFAPPVMTKMPESPTMGADRASLMQAVARVKMNGKNGLERSASGDDAGKGTAALNNGRSRNGAEKEKGLDRKPKKQRRGIFFFSRKKNS